MLDESYKIALCEVEEILKYTDEELVNRIPDYIKEFISENKDLEYIADINQDMPIQNQVLKEETEIILSLLYRSYWCTQEEKAEFAEKDKQEFELIEREKREKYNIDNIFNSNTNENYKSIIKEQALVEVKKESIFTMILNKIKKIFRI